MRPMQECGKDKIGVLPTKTRQCLWVRNVLCSDPHAWGRLAKALSMTIRKYRVKDARVALGDTTDLDVVQIVSLTGIACVEAINFQIRVTWEAVDRGGVVGIETREVVVAVRKHDQAGRLGNRSRRNAGVLTTVATTVRSVHTEV